MKPRFVIRRKETGCIVGHAHSIDVARGYLNSVHCLLLSGEHLEIVDQETGDIHPVREETV